MSSPVTTHSWRFPCCLPHETPKEIGKVEEQKMNYDNDGVKNEELS